MRPVLSALLPLALAGCLSRAPEPPTAWTVDVGADALRAAPQGERCRVASLTVRPPFDGERFAVLRSDGSVAFDPCNVFASSPAALLRGAAQDVLSRSGRFSAVMNGATSAATDVSAEIVVTEFALDARGDRLMASAALDFALIKGREIVKLSSGAAAVGIGEDGNYTRAFSDAFASALNAALKEIPAE